MSGRTRLNADQVVPKKVPALRADPKAEPGVPVQAVPAEAVAWVGKAVGPRVTPPALAAGQPAHAQAVATPKPVAPAAALKPTDALRLVKSGELTLDIPVRPVNLFDGRVVATQETVVRMTLAVKDGNVDFAKSKIKFHPEVKGPMGADMPGAELTADGRLSFQLEWLPDVVLGNAAPARLPDFIEAVTSGKALPVKMLGFKLGQIGSDEPAPETAIVPAEPEGPSNWDKLTQRVNVDKTRVSMTNVQFMDGVVPLGPSGSVRGGPDSKLSLSGTLANMKLSGHVSVSDLALDSGGVKLAGGRGTADVEVNWKATGDYTGSIDTTLSNLVLAAESGVARRQNGDFLELAKGRIEGGRVSFSQAIRDGTPVGLPVPTFTLERFEGTLNGGQVSVPDGAGVAQIVLGKSSVKGSMAVTNERILVEGDVDLNARVTGLDVRGDLSMEVPRLDLKGKAKVRYDSNAGLSVEGPVKATATISGTTNIDGTKGSLGQSTLEITTNQVHVGLGGKLSVAGQATVDMQLRDASVGHRGVALSGGSGSLKGTARVDLDNGRLALTKAALQLSTSFEDGALSLGDRVQLDLKKGSSLSAAVAAASFGTKTTFDLRKAKVTAQLDAGQIKLPNGQKFDFRDGTQLDLSFDRLRFPAGGIPEAEGSMELIASLDAGEIDKRLLTDLKGVSFRQIEGLDQVFRLRMGRFSITEQGAFDVQDLRFGIEAQIRRLTGQIR